MANEVKIIKRTVDFGAELGKIKPMHAVGAGPIQGSTGSIDISNYYRSMNIPYSRLHDTEYPYGSDLFVDIHCIFPDFDADVNDPASYYFLSTDMYIKGIIDAGGKPFYRLGESIDHAPAKRYIKPPKDFKKWAQICEHIIRHYNEGWADGFHYDIEYWEIWNEADSYLPGYNQINMWTGTREQYFELYRVAATHLKECFGDTIKVGGYSCCNLNALIDEVQSERGQHLLGWANDFMAYITNPETKAPLDFFSYHDYFNQPKIVQKYNYAVREWVDSWGFKDIEIIFTEWNIFRNKCEKELEEVASAADIGYIFLSCQKSPTDMMMYYELRMSTTFNYVISKYREILPRYYAFEMFGKLYELGTEVDCGAYNYDEDIAMIAAKNGKKAAIMIANIGSDNKKIELDLKNFEGYEKYTVRQMEAVMSPSAPTLYQKGDVKDKLVIEYNKKEALTLIEFE